MAAGVRMRSACPRHQGCGRGAHGVDRASQTNEISGARVGRARGADGQRRADVAARVSTGQRKRASIVLYKCGMSAISVIRRCESP